MSSEKMELSQEAYDRILNDLLAHVRQYLDKQSPKSRKEKGFLGVVKKSRVSIVPGLVRSLGLVRSQGLVASVPVLGVLLFGRIEKSLLAL